MCISVATIILLNGISVLSVSEIMIAQTQWLKKKDELHECNSSSRMQCFVSSVFYLGLVSLVSISIDIVSQKTVSCHGVQMI
jgi:hypothetical protein